jgi:hypothetical protein
MTTVCDQHVSDWSLKLDEDHRDGGLFVCYLMSLNEVNLQTTRIA